MSEHAPRENLYRAQGSGFELRAEEAGTGSMPTLFGHFTPFDDWAEINSLHEGHFMERTVKGAFKNTFSKHRNQMRIGFEHGNDPSIGNKPIASIRTLREDDEGAYYEGDLLDTGYVRELVPGLEAGVYGASYKFRVMREEWDDEPERSDYNPDGIPERTITEAQVMEFGPVVWGAFEGASAGVRSITDEVILGRAAMDDPGRLARVIEGALKRETPQPAPKPAPVPEPAPAPVPPAPPSMAVARSTPKAPKEDSTMAVDIERFATLDDLTARQDEVASRLAAIVSEFGARAFTSEAQTEFDELEEEKALIAERVADVQHRLDVIADAPPERKLKVVDPPRKQERQVRKPDNAFDMQWYRQNARDAEDEHTMIRDGARSVVETSTFPHEDANREQVQGHIEKLLLDGDDGNGTIARHILHTGSERYKRAFGKYLSGQPRSPEEERALSLAAASGGYAVPFTLDPTIIPTSNLAVNPFRAISRVEQIPGDEWRGVSSAGVTAAYAAEATETTDNAPTLGNPTISTEKAQAFIPFSIEVGMDWGGLQSEMATLLQDAKDELEATKFAVGTGTNEPAGVITGATTTVTAGGSGAFAIADLDLLEAALGPRFRPRASIVFSRYIAQKIRHFDTQGGSAVWNQGVQLVQGLPNNGVAPGGYGVDVLGYPAFESSAMGAVLTTGTKIAILGDFRYYLIADRIGLSVEVIPHLVGTNHRPTGQRGLYAYWRNGAGVLSANAFRVLVTG